MISNEKLIQKKKELDGKKCRLIVKNTDLKSRILRDYTISDPEDMKNSIGRFLLLVISV